MKNEILEQRLRQPVEKASPRPGFETRLQAMARHEIKPTRREQRSRLWLAAPAIAALCLLLVIAIPKKDQPAPIAQTPPPLEEKTTLSFIQPTAFQEESLALKKDARRTADFLFDAFPSISIAKK